MDESPGKLKAKALEHQKFLSRRRRAAGIGVGYPTTRSSKDINEGTAPPLTAAGATGFLGMGSKSN